jgi:hypothetical protein
MELTAATSGSRSNMTAVLLAAKLRYTHLVEMACPLFRRDELDALMSVYDPDPVGYGLARRPVLRLRARS